MANFKGTREAFAQAMIDAAEKDQWLELMLDF